MSALGFDQFSSATVPLNSMKSCHTAGKTTLDQRSCTVAKFSTSDYSKLVSELREPHVKVGVALGVMIFHKACPVNGDSDLLISAGPKGFDIRSDVLSFVSIP